MEHVHPVADGGVFIQVRHRLRLSTCSDAAVSRDSSTRSSFAWLSANIGGDGIARLKPRHDVAGKSLLGRTLGGACRSRTHVAIFSIHVLEDSRTDLRLGIPCIVPRAGV